MIQVGVQALEALDGSATPASVLNVEAWVCYPNTVAGGTSVSLVVPSMQNDQFAAYSYTPNPNDANAVIVDGDQSSPYQVPQEGGFQWVNLSPWTPGQEDLLEEGNGHCCIIANAAGQSTLMDYPNPNSGTPVGVAIASNNQLAGSINVCQSLYQAQRNIAIVRLNVGQLTGGLVFLSGAPERIDPLATAVSITAIAQGKTLDPVLRSALTDGRLGDLHLRPAMKPPRAMRLTRFDGKLPGHLPSVVRPANEWAEEELGLAQHPFGGGHRLRMRLPSKGLQPLRMTVEIDPKDEPGTVHSFVITQTDEHGARGGIRVGVVVVP